MKAVNIKAGISVLLHSNAFLIAGLCLRKMFEDQSRKWNQGTGFSQVHHVSNMFGARDVFTQTE